MFLFCQQFTLGFSFFFSIVLGLFWYFQEAFVWICLFLINVFEESFKNVCWNLFFKVLVLGVMWVMLFLRSRSLEISEKVVTIKINENPLCNQFTVYFVKKELFQLTKVFVAGSSAGCGRSIVLQSTKLMQFSLYGRNNVISRRPTSKPVANIWASLKNLRGFEG